MPNKNGCDIFKIMNSKIKKTRRLPIGISVLIIMILIVCTAGGIESVNSSETVLPDTGYTAKDLQTVSKSLLDDLEMFTPRDLQQTIALDKAVSLDLESGSEIFIEQEGIYILSGEYRDTTVIIAADNDNTKVQLLLDNLSITNSETPAIYVKSADNSIYYNFRQQEYSFRQWFLYS